MSNTQDVPGLLGKFDELYSLCSNTTTIEYLTLRDRIARILPNMTIDLYPILISHIRSQIRTHGILSKFKKSPKYLEVIDGLVTPHFLKLLHDMHDPASQDVRLKIGDVLLDYCCLFHTMMPSLLAIEEYGYPGLLMVLTDAQVSYLAGLDPTLAITPVMKLKLITEIVSNPTAINYRIITSNVEMIKTVPHDNCTLNMRLPHNYDMLWTIYPTYDLIIETTPNEMKVRLRTDVTDNECTESMRITAAKRQKLALELDLPDPAPFVVQRKLILDDMISLSMVTLKISHKSERILPDDLIDEYKRLERMNNGIDQSQ